MAGASILAGVPILYVGLLVARYSLEWCYFLTFVDGLMLNGIFAIVMDLTLYIVVPTRRSLASAAQILCSHALGDAISPYLMGVIADWVRPIITPGGGVEAEADVVASRSMGLMLKHDSPVMDDSLVSSCVMLLSIDSISSYHFPTQRL